MNFVERYKNKANLLNGPLSTEPENINENSFLFTLVYCLRHIDIRRKWPANFRVEMKKHLMNLEVQKDGYIFYNNVLPGDGNPNDQHTSRDQLIAYAVFSHHTQGVVHKKIWRTIWKKFFTYDNVTGDIDFQRIVRPRDWIFLGTLADNPLCFLLMPWFYITGLVTCFQTSDKRTSGAQIIWVQSSVLEGPLSKIMLPIFDIILKKKLGDNWEDKMFSIYYPNDHPINTF